METNNALNQLVQFVQMLLQMMLGSLADFGRQVLAALLF